MSGFNKGDLVECIDNTPDPAFDNMAGLLRVGKIYRVAAVGVVFGELALAFREILASQPNTGYAFHHRRFRKIDDEVTPAFREQMRSLGKPAPFLNPARHSRERV